MRKLNIVLIVLMIIFVGQINSQVKEKGMQAKLRIRVGENHSVKVYDMDGNVLANYNADNKQTASSYSIENSKQS
ncbi:MAG: hypothetical protein QQN41_13405, partial [Nitrosopumilus sp.]